MDGIDQLFLFMDKHIDLVAAIIAAVILICISAILWIGFQKPQEAEAAVDSKALEGTLKKLVEQQALAPSAPSPGAAPQSVGGLNDEEKQMLEERMMAQSREIERLKKELQEAKDATPSGGEASGADAGEVQEMAAKIEDLEARLAEYEIIEDDIADLSLYKEENAKLKAQVEALKKGESPPPEAVTAPNRDKPADKMIDDDIMSEFAEAVKKQKAVGADTDLATQIEESGDETEMVASELEAPEETLEADSEPPVEASEMEVVEEEPLLDPGVSGSPSVESGGVEPLAGDDEDLDISEDLLEDLAKELEMDGQETETSTPVPSPSEVEEEPIGEPLVQEPPMDAEISASMTSGELDSGEEDALMAEFAAAVEMQEEVSAGAASDPGPEPIMDPQKMAEKILQDELDNQKSELEQDLNTEQMMAEAQELANTPSGQDSDEDLDSVLDGILDTQKLAEEAEKIQNKG